METNLAVDSVLLEQALRIGGLTAEQETINLALEEFIKKRSVENVISLFNTVEYDENYDYKKLYGIQGSHTDFLICAVAIKNSWEIFTEDADFIEYEKHIPIKRYRLK